MSLDDCTQEYKGTVEVHGKVLLRDFYYQGGHSDADTFTLDISAIKFRKNDASEWIDYSNIFNGAYIEYNNKKSEVVKKKNNRNLLQIRLQGIDSPELHFPFTIESLNVDLSEDQKNKLSYWDSKNLRQYYGARATHELLSKDKQWKKAVKSIWTHMLFQRLITLMIFLIFTVASLVIVNTATQQININEWLAKSGWAFLAFYNSMSKAEISNLFEKSQLFKNSNIWSDYSDTLVKFDPNMSFTFGQFIDQESDRGSINFPKLFRRQVFFEILKKCGVSNATNLKEFLAEGKDTFFVLNDCMEDLNPQKLAFSEYLDPDGKVNYSPMETIFVENASAELKDANGNPIVSWD